MILLSDIEEYTAYMREKQSGQLENASSILESIIVKYRKKLDIEKTAFLYTSLARLKASNGELRKAIQIFEHAMRLDIECSIFTVYEYTRFLAEDLGLHWGSRKISQIYINDIGMGNITLKNDDISLDQYLSCFQEVIQITESRSPPPESF